MEIVHIQQDQQVYVYLLCRIIEARFGYCPKVESVYTHKVQAEADMRAMQDDSEDRYCVIEHLTQPHNNYV
jgi:hypothetical protein